MIIQIIHHLEKMGKFKFIKWFFSQNDFTKNTETSSGIFGNQTNDFIQSQVNKSVGSNVNDNMSSGQDDMTLERTRDYVNNFVNNAVNQSAEQIQKWHSIVM